jgi:hypothetical protein
MALDPLAGLVTRASNQNKAIGSMRDSAARRLGLSLGGEEGEEGSGL